MGLAAAGYGAAIEAVPIVETSESWGPCPTPESICHQTTRLFESGRLITQGKEMQISYLSPKTVQDILTLIRTSALLEKDCTADPNSIADYGATFRFRLDGHDRSVNFPGCEKDLHTLSQLMELPPDNAANTLTVPSR